jgi:hypothetical protein
LHKIKPHGGSFKNIPNSEGVSLDIYKKMGDAMWFKDLTVLACLQKILISLTPHRQNVTQFTVNLFLSPLPHLTHLKALYTPKICSWPNYKTKGNQGSCTDFPSFDQTEPLYIYKNAIYNKNRQKVHTKHNI